jgi:hypothetical protein
VGGFHSALFFLQEPQRIQRHCTPAGHQDAAAATRISSSDTRITRINASARPMTAARCEWMAVVC